MEQYRNAKDDPTLRALLALFTSTDKIISRFQVQNGVAIALDEGGHELVRVPEREPLFIRPQVDQLYQIRRQNST